MPLNLDALANNILLITAFFGAFASALWLSLIIWTYRDMRARSRDVYAQILAAVVVAVLFLPGLVVYLILRPPQTLNEIYEESLEEEALLQEIEERRTCPGCGRHAPEAWIVCPNCHTKLKKPCANCGRLMELPWNLCPYCATSVEGVRVPEDAPESSPSDRA